MLNDSQKFSESSIYRNYSRVFEGLGKVPFEYNIQLDGSIPPVMHPSQLVAIALQERLKIHLDSMVMAGIIANVTEPTKWVNYLLIVERKNGSLKFCLNPRDLNRAIIREHFRIPTLDDIIHNFHGKNEFSQSLTWVEGSTKFHWMRHVHFYAHSINHLEDLNAENALWHI